MNKVKIPLAHILSIINVDVMIEIDIDLEIEIERKVFDSIYIITSFILKKKEDRNKYNAELLLDVFKLNKVLAKHNYTIVPKFMPNIPIDEEYNNPTYLLANGVINLENFIMVQDKANRKETYYYFVSGELLLDMLKRRGHKQLLK